MKKYSVGELGEARLTMIETAMAFLMDMPVFDERNWSNDKTIENSAGTLHRPSQTWGRALSF